MILRFIDKAPVSGIRRTDDGYAVAEVPVARTGLQDYAGWEVGRPDLPRVTVYRPPETVFADSYLASMAHKPVTNDHPSEAVTADNWDGLAKGWTGETIRKDEANGLVYVPMMLADAKLIDAVESGKREVSCGYTCELEWVDGVTPDGAPFQAIQKNARINHVAVVKRGRAGSACRIGDSWAEFNDKEPVVALKTITFDGLPVEVTDAAEAVINKLTAARDALASELRDAQASEATATEALATRDGEIAALKQQLADATVTPEKLKAMVDARAKLIADAKAIDPDADENDSDADMKRKAVMKKMGHAADALSDAAIDGAFAAYAATAPSQPVTDAFRAVVADGVKSSGDAQSVRDAAYAEYVASLTGKKKD